MAGRIFKYLNAYSGSLSIMEESFEPKALPRAEEWDPPFCGEIDMRIAHDGTWFYNGTPILRPALVRLFASILRKDPGGYVLVTPLEKVGILVEDAPFTAVSMTVTKHGEDQVLRFATNVSDTVEADAEHPLRFENDASGGVKPYIHVRRNLWALATRSLALDVIELAKFKDHEGARQFGVLSHGLFFAIDGADEDA
ncbi:MAG TPA: DUF1285 domain-containing protein [Methylocella sp.]|nr:DUF1285 domain-containing protein [Methylocella sp.]